MTAARNVFLRYLLATAVCAAVAPLCQSAIAAIKTPQALVEFAYQRMLKRDPSPAELRRELQRIKQVNASYVLQTFVDLAASDEFFNLYKSKSTNEAKIELLYQRFLGRPIDASGRKFFLDYMHKVKNDDFIAWKLFMDIGQSKELQLQTGVTNESTAWPPKALNEFQMWGQLDCVGKNYPEAINYLQTAIKMGSNSAVDCITLAQCLIKQNPSEALSLCDRAISQDPGWERPYIVRAMVVEKTDPVQSLTDVHTALSINPKSAAALERRAAIMTLKSPIGTTGSTAANAANAVKVAKAVSAVDSTQAKEKDLIALAYVMAANHHPKASAALTNAIKNFSKPPTDLLNSRADAYLRDGRNEAAIDDLNKSLEVNPHQPEALVKRAHGYFWIEEPEQALADVNAAIKLGAHSADAYALRGEINMLNKQSLQAAVDDFTKAINIKRKKEYLYFRAGTYERLENYSAAALDYAAIVKLTPSLAQAYLNLARAQIHCNQLNEAVANCTRAIGRSSRFVQAYLERAALYEKLGKTKLAEQDRAKARSLANGFEHEEGLWQRAK